MDNNFIQELINETNARGGGLILNVNEKPAIVVLTVDKYNQMMNQEHPIVTNNAQLAMELAGNKSINHSKRILVTGGAGYIGAHLARELLAAGYQVTILDNLQSGKQENVPEGATFIEGDLADVNLLRDLFAASNFEAVVHMAASIEVEESVRFPDKYFENNAINTGKLLRVMSEAGVKKIVFSSTAAVYGQQDKIPISEKAAPRPDNPYGYSKLVAEKIIKYYCLFSGFKAVVFRYFNACGAGFDGQIKPTHTSHLMPIVMEAAKGVRPYILVNGNDYDTFDGTCIRDYVHVLDIADAHVKALEKIDEGEDFRIYNIGTGRGCSVKEVINETAEVLNRIVPMEIGPRRPGDAKATVADNTKIKQELGFEPKYSDLKTIITTTWKQMQG